MRSFDEIYTCTTLDILSSVKQLVKLFFIWFANKQETLLNLTSIKKKKKTDKLEEVATVLQNKIAVNGQDG